ncbi:MAG TPA: hypothetical protein PKC98_12125, partial [Candidatus Melainabacteria bacterium]|nr:hypothetical protein [Candidatus Melainabacteria bacterium]
MNRRVLITATALSLFIACQMADPDFAERRRFVGQNGAAGSFAQQGQYGKRAGFRAGGLGRGAVSAQGGSYTGPNGGSMRRGGFNAYKPGQGGVHASGSEGNTAAGGSWRRGGATGYSPQNGAFHKSGIE